MPEKITVRREKGKVWSYVRKIWLNDQPKESVRQEYLCILVNEYGYSIEQIDEEVSLPGERQSGMPAPISLSGVPWKIDARAIRP